MRELKEPSKEQDGALFIAEKIFHKGTSLAKKFISELFQSAREGNLLLHLEENSPLWEGVKELPSSILGKLIIQENSNFYLKRYYSAQKLFCEHLERLKQDTPLLKGDPEFDPQHHLNEEQKGALQKVFENSLTLIVGGPGTGKSYTAKVLVLLFQKMFPKASIALAAPTGKAAANLNVGLSIKPKTLHSLLREGAYHYDLVLVDEASMIDAELFAGLLSTIRKGARCILLGDPFQLPPVEAGALFSDLTHVEKERCVFLNKTLRTEKSEIIEMASLIKRGEMPPFEILPSPQEIASLTEQKILSALFEGPYGVHALNSLIYNHKKESQVPILITQNDRELSLANGDQGILDLSKREAYFGERSFPEEMLPQYTLAYVISIHKSQGSEHDEVIVLLPRGSEKFGRELLYTAVTRAKKKIRIFVEHPDILKTLLSKEVKRASQLKPS